MANSIGALEALVAITAVVTLPAGVLAAVFLGLQAALVVFVVGWLLLTPVTAIAAGVLGEGKSRKATRNPHAVRESSAVSDSSAESDDDALDRLRDRYAAGEIDDVEFERRVERLIETEDGPVASDRERSERRRSEQPDTQREMGDREPERE